MAEFTGKMTVFAQENHVWFSDQHKWEACVTFDIFVLGRSDWFLKAISRVKKSASEVKIGLIVHHMGTFPQANAALGISRLCNLLRRIKICLGCKYWISSLRNIKHCMSQASKTNIDEKQGQ